MSHSLGLRVSQNNRVLISLSKYIPYYTVMKQEMHIWSSNTGLLVFFTCSWSPRYITYTLSMTTFIFTSLSTISNPTAFFVIFLHILQLNVIHLYVLVIELPSPYGLGKFLPKYPVSFIYLFFFSRLHSFLICWYDSSLHHSIRLPFAGIVLFGTL